MNTPLKTPIGRALAALATALALGAAAPALAQTTTLQFSPSAATLQPGQMLVLDIQLSDLPATADLSFFDIDVVYDPAVLHYGGVSLSNALGDLSLGQAVDTSLPPDTTLGLINLSVLSLLTELPAQPASPVLGQLRFTAAGLGQADLGFGFAGLEDLAGQPIQALRLDAAVSVVPEPAAAWLWGAGLALLLARRRWRV
jgi:hypothetical protein